MQFQRNEVKIKINPWLRCCEKTKRILLENCINNKCRVAIFWKELNSIEDVWYPWWRYCYEKQYPTLSKRRTCDFFVFIIKRSIFFTICCCCKFLNNIKKWCQSSIYHFYILFFNDKNFMLKLNAFSHRIECIQLRLSSWWRSLWDGMVERKRPAHL